jgi:para-aminobenzoate synthetase component 1
MKDIAQFLQKKHFCLLETHCGGAPYSNYQNLAGWSEGNTLSDFNAIPSKPNQLLFGHLGYDLKNLFEKLTSAHGDCMGWADCSFFEAEETRTNFNYWDLPKQSPGIRMDEITADFSREEYIEAVESLKKHIQLGDVYEVTFCIQFTADCELSDPFALYKLLCQISPAPFSAFYKNEHNYLLCASPERFLMRRGNKIITQPIKGTARRSKDAIEDVAIARALLHDPKERAENVMIVDLARNDLSHFAQNGSVKVDELFGIYSFEQVHQMISTISCEIKPEISFQELIRGTFPPGSMTGAPKISAMKLIEAHERHKRGLYSGAVGYIKPNGDFDFNVIIRSIFYNDETKKLAFSVGSAITSLSNPENEYAECLLKAQSIFKALKA